LLWRDVAPNYLGDPNDLENSEDCRGAGGHGNQHVRLRSAQIDCIERSARLRRQSVARSQAGFGFTGCASAAKPPNFLRIRLPSPRKSRAPPRHLQSWQDLLPRLSLGRRQAGLERVRRVKGQRRDKVNLTRARRRSDRPCTHIVLLQTGNFPSPVEYEPKHNACRKLRCFSAFCRVPEALPFDLSLLNVLLLLGESGPASQPI
jgi:hypothetical protein